MSDIIDKVKDAVGIGSDNKAEPSKQSTATTHSAGGVPIQNKNEVKHTSDDSRVPLSAEPGVYKDDGVRQTPLSAEQGVYNKDAGNEPKEGTANDSGVHLSSDKSKV